MKKNSKRPQGFGSKTAFILSQPKNASPAEVAAAGAKAGLTFSTNYVATIRRNARVRAQKVGKFQGTKTASRTTGPDLAKTQPTSATNGTFVPPNTTSVESALLSIAAELGYGRAIELISAARPAAWSRA